MKKLVLFLMVVFAFTTFTLGISSINKTYANTIDLTDAITVRNGAEVRLDDLNTTEKDETGLRFSIKVDTSKVEALLSSEAYAGYTAEYGVALLPTRFLQGQELDVEGTYVYNEKNREVLKIALTTVASIEDGIETYYAVLTNIPSIEYETDITARAFVKLTNGESVIYKQAETTVTRSIGQVLTTCYNDPEYNLGDDRPYYEQLLTQNLGTVSFEKENYTLFKNGVNDKTIVEDVKVYGNKYGFELDLNSEYLDENAISLTYGTDGVANYDNGAFAPVSGGETTATLTVDGKTASTTVKVETEEDLAVTLGTDEIAAFDHKGYETMVEIISGVESEIAVGNYHGKEGVLKVAGTIDGGMSLVKLAMPVAKPGWTNVTFQIYVEQGGLDGLGSIGISVSDSAASWGDGSIPSIYSGKFASNCWFNVCLTSVHENVIYLALSPLTTETGSYFTYYISTIMNGDQTAALYAEECKDVLGKTSLDIDEAASFDIDEYKNLVKTSLVESPVVEILPEYKDANGDVRNGVLHLQFVSKATGLGTNSVEILLPKTISGKATIEYQISINQTAGTVYDTNVWGFLPAAGWGALQTNASVTTWSTLSDSNFSGLNSIKLGFNQWDPSTVILFDLYISEVTTDVDKAANRELYNQTLSAKLVDNQLATFDELAYLNYVEGFFYNSEVTVAYNLAVEIVNDAEKGKVIRISNGDVPAGNYGRIRISLPKIITATFTLNYKVVSVAQSAGSNLIGIQHGEIAGWEYYWPLTQDSNWNTVTIDSYVDKDYFEIILQGHTTFEIYISTVLG
ncbi:MAG: hypothetical protein E7348_04305 [Clostridiales bacterium]|nr:hypothetical protein [Clostridiales bacterium]